MKFIVVKCHKKKKKNTIRPQIKKAQKLSKASYIEVKQHGNILEIKLLIYFYMKCPHSLVDCLMRLENIHLH